MSSLRIFCMLSVLIVSACTGETPTAPTPAPVIPTLTGQWNGNYTITNCAESGAAAGSGFCTAIGLGGTHIFTPQQSGSNLAGNLTLGTFSIPVSGNVGSDNVVALSGSGQVVAGANLTLTAWRATVASNTMTGTMTFTIVTDPPNIGSATVNATTRLTR